MTFLTTITKDGLYHVQNYFMGYSGQHHVHTKKGFKVWAKEISKKDIITEQKDLCNCGLEPSEVREYDGQKWRSDTF